MKLLTKTSIYFLAISLIVFLLGGVSIYYLVQNLIRAEIDDQLIEKRVELLWEFKNSGGISEYFLPGDSSVKISDPVGYTLNSVFNDTLLFSDADSEFLPYRYIKFSITEAEETRIVTIFISLIENEDLIEGIILSLLIVFICTIIAIFAFNILGMNHIWVPFKKILKQIKHFDFRNNQEFEQIPSNISEFNELSIELSKMTQKITRDFYALKEFSENASHEMQTPLAIIQSKLEMLFQRQGLSEDILKALNLAYQATNRLSKLHHELNLLTRIENQEYHNFEIILLKDILLSQIEFFSDIVEIKNLKLTKTINSEFKIQGNLYLIETLISNILSNAIKHNQKNGLIHIQLENNIIVVSNDGEVSGMHAEELFERFKKGRPTSDSTGLGLSIAKQICEYHNIDISYTFNGKHVIKLIF